MTGDETSRYGLPTELVARLSEVASIGVITGAGISAESGIRTYRGRGGVYDDPEEGDRTVEALSGPTLLRDPVRTWRVVLALARESAEAVPGPGHRALVAMERRCPDFTLLTQNVDGLHALAGSRQLIEIHGRIGDTRCMACGAGRAFDRASLAALTGPPLCTACGGTLRPGAVLFGEALPTEPLRRLEAGFLRRTPDLTVVVGTTALFPYIVEPVRLAREQGRLTVEINPEATALSDVVTYSLRARAGEALEALLSALPGGAGAAPS